MREIDLPQLEAEKRAAVAFHVRVLKDRLRIEAAYLALEARIRVMRDELRLDGRAPSDHPDKEKGLY